MKALLILPEPAILERFQIYLAGEGVDCRTAESFVEARHLLESHNHWDLVVTDTDSPHNNGGDILIFLRNNEILAHIPVLICTVEPPGPESRKSRPSGEEYFLAKPIDDDKMAEVIGRIIGARGGKILLVDDEAMVRDVLRAAMEYDGHVVVEADSGVTALKVLAAENIDMVISDMRMPEMSGRELLITFRIHYPEIPFYLISGCATDAIGQELIQAGASGFLPKPFKYAEIIEMVHRGLVLRRTAISNQGAK